MKKYLVPFILIIGIIAAYFVAFPTKNPIKKWFAPEDSTDELAAAAAAEGATVKNGSFNPLAPVVQDSRGFPLMIGSNNAYVSNIQTALNSRYGSELVVDGIFGTKTAKALSAHGFNPDAIYYKHYFQILGKQTL